MNFLNSFKLGQTSAKVYGLIGIAALTLVSTPAIAADINGYTTPNDAACALDPACALPRGGVSDVMTVFKKDGSIFDQIFAFGNEQGNGNGYYFDNPLITVDTSQSPLYYTLLGKKEGYSDDFGIGFLQGTQQAYLGFTSDPSQLAPNSTVTFQEIPYGGPWVPEPGETFTIPYDATIFLSANLRAAGYTAVFQSDVKVPEPSAVMAIVALGIVGAGSLLKRRLGKI